MDKLLNWAQSLRNIEGRGLIIIWMKIVSDLNFKEIGDCLGFSEKTARLEFNKTIAELRKNLVDQSWSSRKDRLSGASIKDGLA